MTVTTESGGRQNAFPNETRPYIDDSVSYEGYPQNAEKVNGRCMIGFVALLGAYATTGQIILVYSNDIIKQDTSKLLERSRTNQWQTCYDGFLCTHSQLWFNWMDYSRFILKNEN